MSFLTFIILNILIILYVIDFKYYKRVEGLYNKKIIYNLERISHKSIFNIFTISILFTIGIFLGSSFYFSFSYILSFLFISVSLILSVLLANALKIEGILIVDDSDSCRICIVEDGKVTMSIKMKEIKDVKIKDEKIIVDFHRGTVEKNNIKNKEELKQKIDELVTLVKI